MSVAQLQSIFHCDSHEAVPPYELVALNHHGSLQRSVRHIFSKRSIQNNYSATLAASVASERSNKLTNIKNEKVKHVKKDLSSKNSYYSNVKSTITNKSENQNSSPPPVYINRNDKSDSSRPPQSSQRTSSDSDIIDLSKLSEHNVSLTAFGDSYNLTLRPTEGLFRHGGPSSLKMWTVQSDANATQGLHYTEIIDVR